MGVMNVMIDTGRFIDSAIDTGYFVSRGKPRLVLLHIFSAVGSGVVHR